MNSLKAASLAFTLIELLTVISIIAVLAALLFPALTSAIESNRQTKCLSNLKQIGAGVMLYVGDNDGELPNFRVDAPDGSDDSYIWQSPQIVGKYVGYGVENTSAGRPTCPPAIETVWSCPSANPDKDWYGTEPDYTGNPYVFTPNAQPRRRLATVRNPSQCLMVADACTRTSVKDGTWGGGED
jgi:prepilin-type N-terminal cleavage/methylation domain-containing protein